MIPKVRSATGLSQPPVLLHARVRNCRPPRCSCLTSIRVKGNRNVEAAPGVHVRPRLVMRTTRRRFPPPWSVEELEACFVVIDNAGQKLSYVYYEEEPGRRSAAELLTKDAARRIAANIAKLP